MVRTKIWLPALVLSVLAQVSVAQNAPFQATLGGPVDPAPAEDRKLPPFPVVQPGSQLPPTLPTSPPLPLIPVTPPLPDRVAAIPNFFGGFYASGLGAFNRVPGVSALTETLTYTGFASDLGGIPPKVTFCFPSLKGPGGPFDLVTNVTGTITIAPSVKLDENPELTGLVKSKFPGATFLNGTGSNDDGAVLFNYLHSLGVANADSYVFVLLPNPSGGGLVGRNNYFENGSAMPHDRVYFFYNHIGAYQGLGTPFDVNRFVFGFEKTFLGGMASVEVRIPFAGTLNSTQVVGQSLSVSNPEFGNVGVVVKGILFRTPELLVSAGMGVSAPTADPSRMQLNGQTVLDIQNRAVLLQPLFGAAWAPTERLYGQFGAQFDFDPTGNPVRFAQTDGSMLRAGVLHDRCYSFVTSALGWWAYRNPRGFLSGVAVQGELDYTAAFGAQSSVQDGNVIVASATPQTSFLVGTTGLIASFGEQTYLSLGVSLPLAGERLYDWSVTAQVNTRFGPRP